MHTDAFNHQPADMLLLAGHMLQGGRDGRWVQYDWGASRKTCQVVVISTGSNMSQSAQWRAGFCLCVRA